MRIIILIVSLLTLALGLVMAFGGPLSQTGLFDWRTAFTIMQRGATPLMVGGGLSLVGLVIGVIGKHRGTTLPALLAIVTAAGVLGFLGNLRSDAGAHPIHDLTTDFRSPPPILAAATAERSNPPRYVGKDQATPDGRTVTEVQKELYPDLQPLFFSTTPDIVFETALKTAKGMGWDILSTDQSRGLIEAVHTSSWFGFKDDVIIRIEAQDGGTLVDLRSKSRVGRSDLGANVKRLRAFKKKLKAAMRVS